MSERLYDSEMQEALVNFIKSANRYKVIQFDVDKDYSFIRIFGAVSVGNPRPAACLAALTAGTSNQEPCLAMLYQKIERMNDPYYQNQLKGLICLGELGSICVLSQ